MKRMQEERDGCLGRDGDHSDPNKDDDKTPAEPPTTEEPIADRDLDKDQLSVNESNSTDAGAEKLRASQKDDAQPDRRAAEEEGLGLGHVEKPSELKFQPDQKSAREDSCNGSSDSIEKKSERRAGLGESEGEEADVQSSASRSMKGEEEEGRSDTARRGSRSGDDGEHDDQSLAVKQFSTEESQPLLALLHTIRAHNFGTLFERRLRTQENSKYQKLILQHIDLGIIETRLKGGLYSGSTSTFFRDLLLLVNNALVFFDKNSAEVSAATEVRWLISKERSQKQAKSDSSSGKHVSLQSLSMTKKEEPLPTCSLVLKPLMVSRKRSSIAAKASTSFDKKNGQSSLVAAEEKDAKPQRSQSNAGEPKITKKRTRDGFPSAAAANTKKNGKNQSGSKNAAASAMEAGKGGSSSSSQLMEPKGENKKSNNTSSSDSKKRGAANFLNRMKQGSPSNSSVLLDALKNTPLTSESSSGKGGSEQQKKSENAKRGEKKEAASRKSMETKTAMTTMRGKEKGSPAKRNVGRPPKRGATIGGKRNRDGGETETATATTPTQASKPGKKRARKL